MNPHYFSIAKILKRSQLHLLTFLLLTWLAIPLAAQVSNESGTIKGKIITSDSLDAELVVVGLKGTNKGATTNAQGEFIIDQALTGNYTLVIQIVGYETIEMPVQVKAGETAIVGNIKLKEDSKTLHEVVVEGNRNKFAQRESDLVARLPLKNIENPQVYNTVGKELMQEQVVVNFDDALKNAPGVNRLWSSTGRASDGAGYFSMRGFSVQPSIINGVAGQTNGGIDPSNIERIETIKGPSGTLFGSSLISFGGLINIVTKRPYETLGGQISYTAGSYDLNRITLDVNAPLNKDKTLLARLNTAYHYEGSFQDAGFKKSFFVAPSISYKANNRLSFLVNTEILNGEGTNPLMVFLNRTRPLIAHNPDELKLNFNRSYTSNDITMKNSTINIFGQVNYKLSDQWTSQTNISRSIRTSDGYYSYVMFLENTPVPNDTVLTRYFQDQNSVGKTTDVQQNFIGDFKIGKMRNRLVVGVDLLQLQVTTYSTPYIVFDKVSSVNELDPNYGKLSNQTLDAKFGASTAASTKTGSNTYTYSAYASNVLNVTDKLLVMASLRVDHFDNKGTTNYATQLTTGQYQQTAFSPKFGLVYQLVKDKVSLFGNYMNGFRNVAPSTTQPAGYSNTFKPQNANQLEGGVKMDAFSHKVSLTACYYNLTVTNITRSEQVSGGGFATVQNGSQQSEGVEFDVIANPFVGFNVIAGYSMNHTKELQGSAATTEGRRPTSAGPENLANLWMSYSLTNGSLKGLGAGIGGNYASENKITNSNVTGEFTLPSYTVFNASIFYNATKYRIGLKLDNLTNEIYYGGWSTVERQMPRRFMANFTYKF